MATKLKYISKERVLDSKGEVRPLTIQSSIDKLADNSNLTRNGLLGHLNVIKDVIVTAGETTVVNHGLGRGIQGYLIILSNVENHIYDLQSTNTRLTSELWLTIDASYAPYTATVNILVF